jgi:hypothetical protein
MLMITRIGVPCHSLCNKMTRVRLYKPRIVVVGMISIVLAHIILFLEEICIRLMTMQSPPYMI